MQLETKEALPLWDSFCSYSLSFCYKDVAKYGEKE